jgi:DNA-binding transcriptional LysR family regulator
MRLRHLEIVQAITRSRNMREAARSLGVSQPAMSQGLKHAEDLLGFDLFLRERGRLLPTPELRALMPQIERVFQGIEEIRLRSGAIARGQQGRLCIATIPTLNGRWLAEATVKFRRLHPRMTLQVVSLPTAGVIDSVLNAKAQIGLLHGPVALPGLHTTKLGENRIVAVLPREHPLARQETLSVRDLRHYEIISAGRGTPPGDLIAAAFARANTPFTPAVEITTSASAAAFVRAGVGVALIDAKAAETSVLDDLVVRPFVPTLTLNAEAAVAADQRQPSAVSAFLGTLCQVARA